MTRQLLAATKALLVLTLVCGVGYPAVVLLAAQLVPGRAAGQPVLVDGREVGSHLLGQPDGGPGWFQGRPSASGSSGETSGGSNLGPTNPDLAAAVDDRAAALRAANPDAPAGIPPDALTASASGLDPDISPAYALWQVPRIATVRGLDESVVRRIVIDRVEDPPLGMLGQARVNVLGLNVALDARSAGEE